jgi:hypothetical protein
MAQDIRPSPGSRISPTSAIGEQLDARQATVSGRSGRVVHGLRKNFALLQEKSRATDPLMQNARSTGAHSDTNQIGPQEEAAVSVEPALVAGRDIQPALFAGRVFQPALFAG